MIKVENIEVWGFEHAIRGMRNPLNSWDRSDSYHAVDCGKCGRIEREGICYPKEHDCTPYYCYEIGENDLMLSEDHQSLVFDSKKIEEAVKFCYFERYKKKLATLRTQATKYGDKK